MNESYIHIHIYIQIHMNESCPTPFIYIICVHHTWIHMTLWMSHTYKNIYIYTYIYIYAYTYMYIFIRVNIHVYNIHVCVFIYIYIYIYIYISIYVHHTWSHMNESCHVTLGDHGVTAPIDVHLMVSPVDRIVGDFIDAGTHILQHTATHCNTLRHTATHWNTLEHTAIPCFLLSATSSMQVWGGFG